MRTRLRVLLACLSVAVPATAVIVDRVAITAGTKVITESEIIRRIRLDAFQNGMPPNFGVASRREAGQRLINQKLVEREMELGHYERASAEQSREMLVAYATDYSHADAEALRLALKASDLTTADLEADLAAQADFDSYLNLRFRPAVQVSLEDIEKYFHDHFESKAITSPVTLSQVRAGIEQILANQRADLDLDVWLQDQRTRTRINYLVKELQ